MSQKHLIVSLHDVHPGSREAIIKQREDLASWGVSTCSLLVVPRFHHGAATALQPDFCTELSQWHKAGDDLVLHGCTHDREGQQDRLSDLFWTRLYTNREAEFLTLSPQQARERWAEGKRLFQAEGWPIRGFIAPAWLFHPSLLDAMKQEGFSYTTTLREIIALNPITRHIPTQSLCYSTRALWRRQLSLLWNQHLHSKLLKTDCIRLSLHPGDIEYPAIWNQIQFLVKESLTAGFKPTTYALYVAS